MSLGPRQDETLTESAFIRLIRDMAQQGDSGPLRVGIGDDCAVLHPPATGCELLATTDQVVEGTHFIAAFHPPRALGRKTLARGLSDIAAMGGRPRWFLLSIVLPRRTNTSDRFSDAWIKQYLSGLLLSTETFGLSDFPLVGGDLAQGERFHANVAVVGEAPAGTALLRSGARVGDSLYVSGSLGGSALGLERLLARGSEVEDPAVERHLQPTPRIALGQFLREAGASAAMDLSDGLSTDLSRLAEASGVAARVDAAAIPRFDGAALDHALHGGEDYELLFAAPPSVEIPSEFQGLPLQRIGKFAEGSGLFLETDGRTQPLTPMGYEHRW